MLRSVLFGVVGLALAIGCGGSSLESGDDGEGGESSGGSSSGTGAIGGDSGSSSGGSSNGGSTTGGTSNGGTGAQGGTAGLGGTAGTGVGGTGGVTTTNPDCPVNEPENASLCMEGGLRCPYITNGCRCLSTVGNGCYQMDSSCVPMAIPPEGDRVAPPPVHWCTCMTLLDPPFFWDCVDTLR